MRENRGVVPRFFLSLFTVLCLTAGTARAVPPVIGDYTAYPPFLPEATSPNILFMIDYSAEMITPAYGACTNLGTSDTLSDCRFTYSFLTYDYTAGNKYEGYFDVTAANQKYSYGVIDTVGGGQNNNGFSKSATGAWSANFLNWLSMTQFDIIKKVVVGGDVTPAPEGARPNKIKSSQYEDRWERKAVNLPGDTAVGASWDACSTLDTPDCVKFPNLTYNWIATPGSATTIWSSNDGITTYDDVVSSPQLVGFTHPFYFYGRSYSYLCISTNGVIGLTNSSTTCDAALATTYTNPDMPNATTGPNNIIAPYWDDLLVLGTAANPSSVKIFTTTIGTAAAPYNQQPYDIPYMSQSTSEVFVISYENVVAYADAGRADYMSFQVLLYEGSNHIVFQYKDVKPLKSFGGGKSATIGVENSDGTIAKKFSYCAACASNAVTDSTALFASPVLTYGIRTTSNGTKAPSFFPAYPLGLALSGTCPATGPCNPGTSVKAGPYDINIKINYQATSGTGWYYNSDRGEYYDHETKGLIQDFRDSEARGGLGFRIAVMKVAGTEGGTVTKHFNDTGGWTNTLGALRDQGPSTGSPLSEALFEAQGYFREDTLYRLAVGDWTYDNPATVPCAATGTNYDPYCFKSAAQRVSCCKSFVLVVSAGNYTYDFRTNIYSDILEASGSGPTPAQAGGYRTVPGETVGQEGTRANGGWLDNVAYKSHTTDLRSDIAGNQNLTIYAVNTFGSISATLTAAISATATTISVDSTTGFPSTGRIQIDDEVISYTGKTATSFTGCARGVDLTTAAAHTSGRDVYKSPGLAQTNLSIAISATDTTITVASTSGFTPSGEIQIDSEVISYTGKTPTSFTGCTRGVDLTLPAAHALAAIVYQEVPAANGTNTLKSAATYGGFEDSNGNNIYDLYEDDKNGDGVPDTYFEASGGSNIRSKIEEAVLDILKRSASGTSVSVLATSQEGEGSLYQAYFYPAKILEGTYEERKWVGYLRGFFLDSKGNIREDTNGDGRLVLNEDYILRMSLDEASGEVKVCRYSTNAAGDPGSEALVDPLVGGKCPLTVDQVLPIWEAGKRLALRAPSGLSGRTVYYTLDGSTLPEFTSDTATATVLQPYLRAADPDGAGALTAVDEAKYIINWIRGVDRTDYRVRCVNMTETLAPGTADGCSTSGWRPWKLGDIVHSTPTVIAAPSEKYDKIYNDPTYLTFKNLYKNRRNVVLVGANDGMIHAFNAGVYGKNDDPSTGSKVEHGWFTANPTSGSGAGWGVGGKTWNLGDELWAFIPRDNLPHLAWLACAGTASDPAVCGNSAYTHVYFNDLKPKVTDVRIFCDTSADAPTGVNCVTGQSGVSHPSGWGTIAIVGMRFGGGPMSASADWSIWYNDLFGSTDFQPSYYALDVTNPEYPPKLLWRFTDSGMGFTTSFPAVVRLGDPNDLTKNRWYAVFGSGPQWWTGSDGSKYSEAYKAKSDRTASVYIVNLQGDSQDGTPAKQFTGGCNGTADTCFETNSSFMGDPSGVDTDVDNKVDVVYIGETYGGAANCWKNSKLLRINLREKSKEETGWLTDDWKTSVFTVNPSYAGTDCKTPTAGQALTIPPSIAKGADKTIWVYYGTGRQWTSDDKADTAPQGFYGIKEGFTAYLTNPNPTLAPTFPSAISVGTDSCVINMTNTVVKTDQSVIGFPGISSCLGVPSPSNPLNPKLRDLITAVRDSDAKGWKVNFGTLPTAERVLNRAVVLGGVVMFTTYTPTADACSYLGDAAIYALYYETGTAYEFPVLTGAIRGASSVGGATTSATGGVTSGGDILVKQTLEKGMPTSVGVAIGEEVRGFIQQSTGTIGSVKAQPALNVRSGVRGWKEKLK